ncbi:MAG: CRTAC1 family protein [Pedosphaera sp.]|nr:CRTAC1 family protein [Pedosphaera sp.]
MRDRSPGKRLAVIAVLILTAGAVLLAVLSRRNNSLPPVQSSQAPSSSNEQLAAQLTALEARENQLDQTVWAKERIAEQYGHFFESLWDLLNIATNKLAVLAAFPIGELIPGQLDSPQSLAHGIELRMPSGSRSAWTPELWRKFLADREREGWQIAQTEFRHNRFEMDSIGQSKRSYFYFSAHLTNSMRLERATVDGDLIVDWAPEATSEDGPVVKGIDASHLTVKTRRGEPAFRPVLIEKVKPPEKSYFIDPLILYDLDGDGLSEIVLAAKNLVLRRRTGDQFAPETLCRHSTGLIFTGLIADFDGDGAADFLCAKFEGLVLFKGSPQGTFDEPGRLVWTARPRLKYGQTLACGDIDHDGDLDIWLGQYKVPYERGQIPTPFYDANDGHPSYLLLNDGDGNFSDVTAAAGLGDKRWRRCYSSSFVDLDGDGHLDLMVVSDFAGLDLFANDGHGHFKDITREWVAESHAFGMAHTLADFDADGRLDFLMVGMNSPTADRLGHLGLTRPGVVDDAAMRSAATFGNRLYMARGEKPMFQETSLNNTIARSGWSWGCSAFDFDNDGFPDVYIANGHESQLSVRDYEPEFWLHDIYVGSLKESIVTTAYFGSKIARTRGRGFSYGGYEKNRLYLNERGQSFLEIGHLMGVALEQDSRNVVADDLDGDGRVDLIVTTFEAWPEAKQTVRVFKNTLEDSGNWIGFRLREQGGGVSPMGARITLRHAGGAMTRQIVTGDSFRSQHAYTVHFGLGKIAEIESVAIRWMNGRSLVLSRPALNQYHSVSLPAAP